MAELKAYVICSDSIYMDTLAHLEAVATSVLAVTLGKTMADYLRAWFEAERLLERLEDEIKDYGEETDGHVVLDMMDEIVNDEYFERFYVQDVEFY